MRPVLKYLIKCERKQNKDIKDLFSMVINSKQRSEGQITPPVHPSIVVPMEVAPKFRKMEEGEDIIVFLEGFEAHQTAYQIEQSRWSVSLASLLPAEVLAVLQAMKKEEQSVYCKVREKLYKHFHVSQMTFSRMIDEFERKPGERWVACAQRILRLVKKWSSQCKTVEEVCELFTLDKLLKIMTKQIAVKVKEKRPEVLEETAEWADNIRESLDWRYEVVPNKEKVKKPHKFVKLSQSEISSKQSKVSDRDFERNEKRNKSDKFKFDKTKIQCYACHKMGHYKSECPQSQLEESHLVEDLIDKADEVPTREEQKEVFLRAT